MANHQKPFCSVIVLNYFGEKVIRQTIDSLLHLNYPKERYEIIIIDNDSRDASKRVISELSRKNKIIRFYLMQKNLGFSKGNNIGIKHAKGEYVALLNNDCIVDKNWLLELTEIAKQDKKIFAVASKIYLQSSKKIQNAGILMFQNGYGRDIGSIVEYGVQSYEMDMGQYDKEKEVYAACGAAVMYRKNVLDQIGYLDEMFFMYYEDVEISERARLHGYKIMYSPKAIVYHYHALSSKEWSPFFIYHSEKGRLLHLVYHFPMSVFVSEYFLFFITAIGRFLKDLLFLKNVGKNVQYLKMSLFFMIFFPLLLIQRMKKHGQILEGSIYANYKKILSGQWYFN